MYIFELALDIYQVSILQLFGRRFDRKFGDVKHINVCGILLLQYTRYIYDQHCQSSIVGGNINEI